VAAITVQPKLDGLDHLWEIRYNTTREMEKRCTDSRLLKDENASLSPVFDIIYLSLGNCLCSTHFSLASCIITLSVQIISSDDLTHPGGPSHFRVTKIWHFRGDFHLSVTHFDFQIGLWHRYPVGCDSVVAADVLASLPYPFHDQLFPIYPLLLVNDWITISSENTHVSFLWGPIRKRRSNRPSSRGSVCPLWFLPLRAIVKTASTRLLTPVNVSLPGIHRGCSHLVHVGSDESVRQPWYVRYIQFAGPVDFSEAFVSPPTYPNYVSFRPIRHELRELICHPIQTSTTLTPFNKSIVEGLLSETIWFDTVCSPLPLNTWTHEVASFITRQWLCSMIFLCWKAKYQPADVELIFYTVSPFQFKE
jgi:hypothetical protein